MKDIVQSFGSLRVLVVGDAILDSYVRGTASRVGREAPVPVIEREECIDVPGGASNTAVNCAALGARTDFLSVIGDDESGRTLSRLLQREGVNVEHVIVDSQLLTQRKVRYCAGEQILLRVDEGSRPADFAAAAGLVTTRLLELGKTYDAIFVADYTDMLVDEAGLAVLAERPSRRPLLFVDAHHLERYRMTRPAVVKPNFREVQRLLGKDDDAGAGRMDWIRSNRRAILRETGAETVAVTLDADGAIAFQRSGDVVQSRARAHTPSYTVGAGDTFFAAWGLARACGAGLATATDLASAAADVVVDKPWTAPCYAAELLDRLPADKLLANKDDILRLAEDARTQGTRVVLTTGCFDLLHPGHVAFLRAARELGDALVVGLSSDEEIRRTRGPGRPVERLSERLAVVAALEFVDHVAVVGDGGAVSLFEDLQPATYAVSEDEAELPPPAVLEALNGSLVTLPVRPGYSTTGLVNRLRSAS